VSNCSVISRFLKEESSVKILYHWDCDGIASAAITYLFRESKNLETLLEVPQPEIYDESTYESLTDKENLVVLDYAVYPKFKAYVVDHHIVNYEGHALICNPIMCGAKEDEYPSTTMVIYKYIISGYEHLVALGILGDLGLRALHGRWRRFIESACKEYSVDVKDLIKASEILNSCYALLNRNLIFKACKLLIDKGVGGILGDSEISSIKERIDAEVRDAIANAEKILEDSKIVVFSVDVNSAIVSRVGRALASKYADRVIILIARIKTLGIDRMYIRSTTRNLSKVLHQLRLLMKRISMGGKDSIISLICSSNRCSKELPIVLSVLKKLRGE